MKTELETSYEGSEWENQCVKKFQIAFLLITTPSLRTHSNL